MGLISGMVSQLTCCSLVSVMVRVSVSRLFSSASAACGRLLIRQPVKPSRALNSKTADVAFGHYRQYEHNSGSGVEHRWACQQLVTHVMGDIAVVADAGDDNRRRGGE